MWTASVRLPKSRPQPQSSLSRKKFAGAESPAPATSVAEYQRLLSDLNLRGECLRLLRLLFRCVLVGGQLPQKILQDRPVALADLAELNSQPHVEGRVLHL